MITTDFSTVEMSTVPCDELYGDAAECLQEASVGACDAEDCASLVDRFNATCTQQEVVDDDGFPVTW